MKNDVPVPSEAELKSFLFVTKGRTIETVPNLYDRKYLDTQYNELLGACAKVNTETMTEQATIIVKDTSNQSSCNVFYRKQTCQTNPVKPSHSPIATMCYPNIFKFSTAATEHGCKHEKSRCCIQINNEGKAFKLRVKECGLFLN